VSVPRTNPSDRTMRAYYVLPDGPGPFPGLVVIHEIFGLNENIREVAGRFADEGFATLAVDLFSTAGKVYCLAGIFHGILVRPLNNRVVNDLQCALKFLREREEVDPLRIGAVGFCMGGSFALQLAIVDGEMQAASVFYAMNPKPLGEIARACPIVGSYPQRDPTARHARRLEPALEHYQVPHDIRIYPGAFHSFFNDRGRSYQAEAAADAWRRTLAFFSIHLQNPSPD
jgi:carboxymethylenebutenolidase